MANIDPGVGLLTAQGAQSAPESGAHFKPVVGLLTLQGVLAGVASEQFIDPGAGILTVQGALHGGESGAQFKPGAGILTLKGATFGSEAGIDIMPLKHTVGASLSKDTLVDIALVPLNSTLQTTVTVPGVKIDRIYLCHIVGLDTGLIMESIGIGTGTDTLQLRFVNPTASNINPGPSKTLHVVGL